MHGLIFVELKKYVEARLGAASWPTLLVKAGLGSRLYMPIQAYPDQEALALVSTASTLTGQPADAILQDFGEFIVPDLMRMYGSLLRKQWNTLDILEHTEETIHRVVRSQNPGADPPRLRCARVGPEEVVITYASSRRMCGVAKGITRGIAKRLAETVVISESVCMLRGGPTCEISVRLDPRDAA